MMMKLNPTKAWFQRSIDAVMERFNNFYAGVLGWCVRHRKTVILVAVAAFVGVLMGPGSTLKSEFFPVQDNARIGVDIQLPVGTGQNITRDLALELSRRFREA